MTKLVYNFGDGQAEGNAKMNDLLGGKGANLAEMCVLGIPVPPGFTITTEVCNAYYKNNQNFPDNLAGEINSALAIIENKLGKKFGSSDDPLLVSVRSGARASMPGMMDTVLNLGLNDKSVEGLAKKTGNERFAYDSYRRFIQMYADVVMGVDHYNFESILDDIKLENDVTQDTELDAEHLKKLVDLYKNEIKDIIGKSFPQDPHEQLWGAIKAVFNSWMNQRAKTYRKLNNIPQHWGTAVNIQSMVFGNMGDDCATGVAFTRDPSTGENRFYGEYLINAQGEDVVAGIRTPQSITIYAKEQNNSTLPAMEESMPKAYDNLVDIYKKLEAHYRDMQDIEFTIENGKLWILQTRKGKRSANAAIKIAVDLAKENIISKEDAILMVSATSLDQILHPTLVPDSNNKVIDKGLPASPGGVSGEVVFSADAAEAEASNGKNVILVRIETSPDDIHGMNMAKGILTARGGMTSHAAVVARGMGKCCICGAGNLNIDYKNKQFKVGEVTVKEGDVITLNGSTGEVILGKAKTKNPILSEDFKILMSWADETRKLKIRTNAETAHDAEIAVKFGAEGIGLCRTEHMFFEAERVISVREMILSESLQGRQKALDKILPMQKQDFIDLFKIMRELPVTVRLLDPPLHEFLPHSEEDINELTKVTGKSVEYLNRRTQQLHEHNPMLGHRGCRLAISYPEIYAMQVRAIIQAAIYVTKHEKITVKPEIMIPLVAGKKETVILKDLINKIAGEEIAKEQCEIEYMIGTMIELPRAALRAAEIAEHAEFFSFGTNDLTQTTYGLSRDDAGAFINDYLTNNIIPEDPFVQLDTEAVGELMEIAVERGQKTRPDIKLGICGEHGGNPHSIDFCDLIGLDYVSCSPYRVPIARLAAAQATIKNRQG
ncbi:MAG: pyruvate, phosphate dikinase [Pseudomonadota bacterium]